jgi:hypothetical protein
MHFILTCFFGAHGFLFRVRTYRFPIANEEISRFVLGIEVLSITSSPFEGPNDPSPHSAAFQLARFTASEPSIGSFPVRLNNSASHKPLK